MFPHASSDACTESIVYLGVQELMHMQSSRAVSPEHTGSGVSMSQRLQSVTISSCRELNIGMVCTHAQQSIFSTCPDLYALLGDMTGTGQGNKTQTGSCKSCTCQLLGLSRHLALCGDEGG